MRLFARTFPVVLVLILSLSAEPRPQGQAQVPPVIDHIHLGVPDQAKAVEWYQKFFDGKPMAEGPDRLMFGDTRLNFLRNANGQPSSGSGLDHLGFSVANLDAKMKEFEAAGVKIVAPARDVEGLFKLAFVEDPWGTRIEVVQDPEKLGLHHVHLRTPDVNAAIAWYKAKFGGEPAKLKNRIDGLRYSGVWLLFQRGDSTPTDGRAIDHIGWRTTNLDMKARELKSQGVRFTTEPTLLRLGGGATVTYSYLDGPAGVKIELVQR